MARQPEFWGSTEETSMARSLRLAIVASQYREHNLTKQDALKLLKGRLDPDVEESAVDDSEWLEWLPEKEVAE
jgi:hypothetical protein